MARITRAIARKNTVNAAAPGPIDIVAITYSVVTSMVVGAIAAHASNTNPIRTATAPAIPPAEAIADTRAGPPSAARSLDHRLPRNHRNSTIPRLLSSTWTLSASWCSRTNSA